MSSSGMAWLPGEPGKKGSRGGESSQNDKTLWGSLQTGTFHAAAGTAESDGRAWMMGERSEPLMHLKVQGVHSCSFLWVR